MKKFLNFFYVACLFSVNALSQNCTIKGKIIDADTVMILLRNVSSVDTLFSHTGEFTFNKKLSYPEHFWINIIKNKQSIEAIKEGNERKMRSVEDAVSRELFLEGGKIMIKSSFSNFKDVTISMTQHKSQDKFEEFQKRFKPLVKVARAIIDSSYANNKTEAEKKLCTSLFKKVVEVQDEVIEKFVLDNTDNAVGSYIFYRYMQKAGLKKLDSIYRLYKPDLFNTVYLKNMKTKIDAMYNLSTGKPISSFSSVTSSGISFTLTDLKGKYTVLDFWGTWCPPCIQDFPKMKEYYKKYKAKVEFVGIACDDKQSVWRDAIKNYNLNWIQILNKEGSGDLTKKFNILAFPTKILIDDKGNLVQTFVGNSEEFYQKLDSLLKEKK